MRPPSCAPVVSQCEPSVQLTYLQLVAYLMNRLVKSGEEAKGSPKNLVPVVRLHPGAIGKAARPPA
eukprot:9292083-Pyramimonas_sp.AAC.1